MHAATHTVRAAGSVSGRAEEGAFAGRANYFRGSIKIHKRGAVSENSKLLKRCRKRHQALSLSGKTTVSPTTSTREASNVV